MTAFINGRIFDGECSTLRDGLNVFIAGDQITEVSDRPPNSDDGEVVDCAGRTIMPGLIDAHIHAYALSVRLHDVDLAPPSLRSAWAGRMLGNMLARGFTTVRDTGGADYGLYLALERGYIRGPRLYYCGRAISMTGGHGDFRDPHHHHPHDDQLLVCGCGSVHGLGIVVDGVDAITRVVRESLFRGSNFIKFMGSGGVSSTGDKLTSIQFSDEEVRAIVGEVERHGAYCTAHIHPDTALRRAISLGVHCIEHGTLIEPETARMAANAGTAIVPTMAIVASLAKRGRELGYPEESLAKLATIKDQAVERLQHMKDAGVRIGLGTDLLGDLENDQLTEFHIRNAVFSNHEILVQATSGNAEIIGAKGELGVIRTGAKADILVVDGDPLIDLAAIATPGAPPWRIYSRGKCVAREDDGS